MIDCSPPVGSTIPGHILYHALGPNRRLSDPRVNISEILLMGCIPPIGDKGLEINFSIMKPEFQFMVHDQTFGISPDVWPERVLNAWQLRDPPKPIDLVHKVIRQIKINPCEMSVTEAYCLGIRLDVIASYMGLSEEDIIDMMVNFIQDLMNNTGMAAWALNVDLSCLLEWEDLRSWRPFRRKQGLSTRGLSFDKVLGNNALYQAWRERGFADIVLPEFYRDMNPIPLSRSLEEKVDRMRPMARKYALNLYALLQQGHPPPDWFRPLDLDWFK